MDKITFLKSISPVTVIETPSEKSLLFLEKWSSLPELQNAKKQCNQLFGTTVEMLNITALEGSFLKDHPIFQTQFVSVLLTVLPQQALAQHNLGEEWLTQLILYIFFDAFIDVEYFQAFIDRKFEFVIGKKNIATRMFDYPQELGAILVPHQTNKQQLKDWIDENWQDIEDGMDKTLTEFQPFLKEYQDLEIKQEIDALRKSGKTYQEISTHLTDKHPHDKKLTDAETVKKMHYRYIELRKKLEKQFPYQVMP